MPDNRKNIKRTNLITLIFGIAIVLVVNFISSYLFTRFDLTAEKRYSISLATKNLLRNLDDIVYFKVYLYGSELPPAFQRLSNETREMLDEFRAYSDNVHYEFIDLNEISNTKDRNDAYRLLVEKNLKPTDLRMNKKGESSQVIIFPGALVSHKGKEVPLQLLMAQLQQDPQTVLNNSVQSLEYNLATAIQTLSTPIKPRIAFIQGHGELSEMETFDLHNSLSDFYNVDRVVINHKITSLAVRLNPDSTDNDVLVNKYRVIIIARPLESFDEQDKFLIDQFIMRGGKVLWMIDPVHASMDSLQKYISTMGIPNYVNLDDMLFHYGVRLNTCLVQDLNALPIPVKTGMIGDQPQFDFFKWYFFPVIIPTISHPVVNGLNAIRTEFVGTLDTVSAEGVRKTFLLETSEYSRTLNAPVFIDLDILRQTPDERAFRRGPYPVAVLLEGEFTSAYLHRIPPDIAENQDLGFRAKSKPTKMIVMTDGDLGKNQFHLSQGYPLPLGFDQYTRQSFGNKELLLNAVNYLSDETGLISVRSRELKLRLLDSARITRERLFWQLINTAGPVMLIILSGALLYRLRKKIYSALPPKLKT